MEYENDGRCGTAFVNTELTRRLDGAGFTLVADKDD
jgi:hypothetical protein